MTGHHESIGPDPALSSDSVGRVTHYQTVGNARLKGFALLEAQGVPASEADDLVATLEVGAVAGAQCEVVELGGMAPASRGAVFVNGWDDGVTAVSEALVGIADRDWSRRGGRSAGAAELAVSIADVRQRERTDLVRLEAYDGDYVVCTLDAGHYDPDEKPSFKDGKPGGWHKADASIWNDLGAACIPHAAL
ncbi:hypothetical protein [Streptomyces asiaticus]|uniref:hypothetical protein n=1 Tax=Streptomyces asiaticus TaxID=114695 RepID=UPI003826072D